MGEGVAGDAVSVVVHVSVVTRFFDGLEMMPPAVYYSRCFTLSVWVLLVP